MPEEIKYFKNELFNLLSTELPGINETNGYSINIKSFYDFVSDNTKLDSYLYPASYAVIYSVKPTRYAADGKISSQDIFLKVGIVSKVSREDSTNQILNIIDSLTLYLQSKSGIDGIHASDMNFVSLSVLDVLIFNVLTEEFVEVQFDLKISVRIKF
jgi:hypothetical protein